MPCRWLWLPGAILAAVFLTAAPVPALERDTDRQLDDLVRQALELKRTHPDDAIAILREVIRRRPSHAEAHRVLAWTYYDLGRNDQAIEEFRAVLKSAPRDSDAARQARIVLKELGAPVEDAAGGHDKLAPARPPADEFDPETYIAYWNRRVRWRARLREAVTGGDLSLTVILRPGYLAMVGLRKPATQPLAVETEGIIDGLLSPMAMDAPGSDDRILVLLDARFEVVEPAAEEAPAMAAPAGDAPPRPAVEPAPDAAPVGEALAQLGGVKAVFTSPIDDATVLLDVIDQVEAATEQRGLAEGLREVSVRLAREHEGLTLTILVTNPRPFDALRAKLGEAEERRQRGFFVEPGDVVAEGGDGLPPVMWQRYGWVALGVVDGQVRLVRVECREAPAAAARPAPPRAAMPVADDQGAPTPFDPLLVDALVGQRVCWVGTVEKPAQTGDTELLLLLRVIVNEGDNREHWRARVTLGEGLEETLPPGSKVIFAGRLRDEKVPPVERPARGGRVWVDQQVIVDEGVVVGFSAAPEPPPEPPPEEPAMPGEGAEDSRQAAADAGFDPAVLADLVGLRVRWTGTVERVAGRLSREIRLFLMAQQEPGGDATEWRVRVRLSKPLPERIPPRKRVTFEGLLEEGVDSRIRLYGTAVRRYYALRVSDAAVIEVADRVAD